MRDAIRDHLDNYWCLDALGVILTSGVGLVALGGYNDYRKRDVLSEMYGEKAVRFAEVSAGGLQNPRIIDYNSDGLADVILDGNGGLARTQANLNSLVKAGVLGYDARVMTPEQRSAADSVLKSLNRKDE